MAGVKRQSNGEVKPIGPNPSTIRVSAPYLSQASIEKNFYPTPTNESQEKSQADAREDSVRLQGVAWLDTTRRALQLPVRTFGTACVYYHKFRLAHPGAECSWSDASAASLLTSCKVEDTLKKSRDILAAAYNTKPGTHELLGSDDALFEGQSKIVIGLERLVLEAGGFDFRSRYPHQLLVKFAKHMRRSGVSSTEARKVGEVAFSIITDLHRTFAPLKQTSATMALAALELAVQLVNATADSDQPTAKEFLSNIDLQQWSITRDEVMETLLDALDLYTHHITYTILASDYSLEDFLRIRLMLNKECTDMNISRYTTAPETVADNSLTTGSSLRVTNGHPTPVSPPQPGVPIITSTNHALTNKDETQRFMTNPDLASDERRQVQSYFVEEWEEYEEEIQVAHVDPPSGPRVRSPPASHSRSSRPSHFDTRRDHPPYPASHRPDPGHPYAHPRSHPHAHHQSHSHPSYADDRRLSGPPREGREREHERMRDRDRDFDREALRARERDRERERAHRYPDARRYDDRRHERPYDDRRGRY